MIVYVALSSLCQSWVTVCLYVFVCYLLRQLRKAVMDHVSDSFLETNMPLLVLINTAKAGDERNVEEHAKVFQVSAFPFCQQSAFNFCHQEAVTLIGINQQKLVETGRNWQKLAETQIRLLGLSIWCP